MDEYWWCTLQALQFENGQGPTSVVDDGGDMTMMLMEGVKWSLHYKADKSLPVATEEMSDDEVSLIKILREIIPKTPDLFETLAKDMIGVSEETTTGVLRLNQL